MSTAVGYCHKVQACHWRRHFPDLTNNKSFKHLLKNLRNSSTSATYRLSHKTSIVPSYKASSWINHQNQITVCTVHFVFAQCQHYWILQRAWCVVFVISMTEFYIVCCVCLFSVGLNSVSTECCVSLLSAWLNSSLCAVFANFQYDWILFLQRVCCVRLLSAWLNSTLHAVFAHCQYDWILFLQRVGCVCLLSASLCMFIISMAEIYRVCCVFIYKHDRILHCVLWVFTISMTEICNMCCVFSVSRIEVYAVCCVCSLSAWLKSAICAVCSQCQCDRILHCLLCVFK